ncbi:MAG: thioredoxin family protein [Candidatus Hydrogenedentes bacterium]|nr:thioredoxin family protein [Candidatus Hydrogenedentota bacterium]
MPKNHWTFRIFPMMAMVVTALVASAQGPEVTYTATVENSAPAGSAVRAVLTFNLGDTWHVNAHKPLDQFLIPTELTVAPANGITLANTVYPEHILFDLAGDKLAVYEHTFHIGVVLQIAADTAPGEHKLAGELKYQACNNEMCFPPAKLPVEITVQVGEAGAPANPELFSKVKWPEGAEAAPAPEAAPAKTIPETIPAPEATPAPAAGDWKSLADQFNVVGKAGYENTDGFLSFLDASLSGKAASENGAFAGKSWGLIILLIIGGGLALNLTPCVLPLIPINVAIIGAGAKAGSRGRGFALGGAYGAGMSLVYGLLGLAVMLSFASAFGTINATPWFNGLIAALFIVLGLAMFDLIQIDFTKFQAKLGIRKNEKGSFGIAFAMGSISALLAGACVAPVVISTILFAQDSYSQGNTLALALPFLLGVGMALPWPFVGAGLSVMPKPGMWMVRVKQAFGVFIIGFAIYYGYQAWTLMRVDTTASEGVKEGWYTSLEEGLAEAKATGKPVVIDFWATWCKNCLKMDATTLKDPAVIEKLEGFVKIKYQAERPDLSPTKEIMEYYGVIGMPAYRVLKLK